MSVVTCHGNNKLIQRPLTMSQEQFIYDPVRLSSVAAIVRDCCENVLENSSNALKMRLVCAPSALKTSETETGARETHSLE